MQINNLERQSNGSFKADILADQEELTFLVNFAITSLLQLGAISFNENLDSNNIDIVRVEH